MTHFELLKYAKTGIASPEMTAYDKMRAVSMGGGAVKTLTGVPPLTFKANGKPLISLSMLGNSQQTGTPSPDNIIMPEFCGKLVGTDWIIPITNAGQTTPVYLGQVQTTRKIKKLVLTGMETVESGSTTVYIQRPDMLAYSPVVCSHYQYFDGLISGAPDMSIATGSGAGTSFWFKDSGYGNDAAGFKSYLAAQYANGTPVTIWYALSSSATETGIVNEPLAKIGTYADELHSEDAGVSIPTVKGHNTLTVETDLQPSSMTITYRE